MRHFRRSLRFDLIVIRGRDCVSRFQAIQHPCHPCPADAKKTGECCPTFKLAGVEKGLTIVGDPERIVSCFFVPFWFARTAGVVFQARNVMIGTRLSLLMAKALISSNPRFE